MRSLLAISFSQTTWNPIWRFFLYQSWNLRSLLATFIDEYRKRDPFWRSQTTWNPIWWFLLFKAEMWGPFWRPPSKYKIPSSDLNNLESHLVIPFIQKLKFEVPSGDLYRNTRSLLSISTTWNPIWRFLFTACYRCRSSCWQGLKTIIFSSCCS